jgi:predicted small lipoprotein YifL
MSRNILVLIVAAAALTACGKTGALERPGPLFGPERATAKAADDARDPTRPVDTIDPRDRTTDPAPPSVLPIEGTPPDPFERAPQGAVSTPGR